MNQASPPSPANTILDALVFFVLLSLLTSFIESTYVFGLLGTDIPPEIVFVLFLLSPVLLVIFPRVLERRAFALVTGTLGLLCWAISLPFGTRWRMLATGAGCGLMLLFLPAYLRQIRRTPPGSGAGLGGAVLLSMLLRALRSGNLLLVEGLPLALGYAVALAGFGLLLFLGARSPAPSAAGAGTAGFGRTVGLSFGVFGALVMLYFGFTSPTVIARWGEASYPLVVAVEAGSLVLFLGLWLGLPRLRARLAPGPLLVWNLLFLLALSLALFLRRPAFAPEAMYPLDAPEPGILGTAALWAMLALHPVIYADFALFAGALHAERPSPRTLAGAFAIGALFLLLMAFAQIFTTVYDYIPVIGPWFRDQFWLVTSLPGLIVTLAALLLRRESVAEREPSVAHSAWQSAVGVSVAALLSAGAVLLTMVGASRPAPAPAAAAGLRIFTYNIQQGESRTGEKSFAEQLEVIRQLQPDILGLQETDMARIAGGNSDVVRYFADALDMHACYGPTPVSGTFGIALLSRYPLEGARTFYLQSEGEQTAAIEARIEVGSRRLHVLVTHLDNDGAMVQQVAVLGRAAAGEAGGTSNAAGADAPETDIVMGDFNFKASTPQYAATTAILEDAWLAAAERTVEPGAPDPSDRVDHIFVSTGTRVLRSVLVRRGPSDHPGMYAEIGW